MKLGGTRRIVLAIVLALVPAVPIVVAVASTGGTAKPGPPITVTVESPPAPPPAKQPGALPPGTGAVVAAVTRPTEMYAAPGNGGIGLLHTKTKFGSPAVLWVAHTVPGWLGVVSAIAGDGKLGWIPDSAATLSRVDFELHVALAAHKLTVREGGHTIATYPVADGSPADPTPTGRFGVTDRIRTGDPTGPYGCCILALTAVSPHPIENWSGGNLVAIHSTPESWTIGYSLSHGCVRVSLANGRWLLDHIPLGTPTYITS